MPRALMRACAAAWDNQMPCQFPAADLNRLLKQGFFESPQGDRAIWPALKNKNCK
jgi:hypothetical protein